jgi:hypothetical protein
MQGQRELVEEFAGWEEKDWDAVVFSDKSKFNVFGSDGKRYCCRRKGDCYKERNVKKMVKHGGRSLMVWGCITRWGTGPLIRVVGNMDGSGSGSGSDGSVLIRKNTQARSSRNLTRLQYGPGWNLFSAGRGFKAHIPTCNGVPLSLSRLICCHGVANWLI